MANERRHKGLSGILFLFLLFLVLLFMSKDVHAEEESDEPTYEEALAEIKAMGLTDDYEIFYAIVKYCAEHYDYSAGFDCWASTSFICSMCEEFGIEARSRIANREPLAGSGHRNAIAKIGDTYYIGDAGYSGKKPRYFSVREEPMGLWVSSDGVLIQYDGFDDDLIIPEKVGDVTIRVIGSDQHDYSAIASYNRTLRSVHFPSTVEQITGGAFLSNTGLEEFTVDGENKTFAAVDGVLYSKDMKTLVAVPNAKEDFKIPSTVKEIGSDAFSQNSGIKHIILPPGLTTIREWAFYECGAADIFIPDSVTLIEEGAFVGLGSSYVAVPGDTEVVGDYVFARGTNMVYTVKGSQAEEAVNRMEQYVNVWSQDENGEYVMKQERVENPEVRYITTVYNGVDYSPDYNYFTFAYENIEKWQEFKGNPDKLLEYYVKSNNFETTEGWKTVKGKTYYFDQNGNKVTGVQKISGRTFYFNRYGVLQTGVLKTSKGVFYLNPDMGGAMHTGWLTLNGNKYYFGTDGKMVTGVKKITGKTYYFNKYGIMQTGAIKIAKKWYYFHDTGELHTGWLQLNSKTYYMGTDGAMQTGVKKIDEKYYAFNKKGVLQKGWKKYKGYYYHLDQDGVMAVSCRRTIDNRVYTFDEKGRCTNDRIIDIAKAETGDIVILGSYEQDNNLENGAEAIEWVVLDKDTEGNLLVISKYGLDAKAFDDTDNTEDVIWEDSSLRSWLNDSFYGGAFNASERSRIKKTNVVNEANPYWNEGGGANTEDWLFLLSIQEAESLFGAEGEHRKCLARTCKPSEYAVAQGAWSQIKDVTTFSSDEYYEEIKQYEECGDWWLRTHGSGLKTVSYIGEDGFVYGNDWSWGEYAGAQCISVRPTMWIQP